MTDALPDRATAERKVRDSEWPGRVARVGILSRGVIHLLVGWLAVRVATGDLDERADQRGALAAVVRQPLGRVLVLLLALGFLCYAAWRLLEAVLDPDDKGPVQRAGQAARALLYLVLFATALRMATSPPEVTSGGGDGGGRSLANGAFGLPAGKWLVLAAGLAVVGTGLWNGYRAVTRSFAKRMKEAEMSSTERTWAIRAGVVGHFARMLAFLVVGWFLVQAALNFDPQQPVGLDESLHALAGRPSGPFLLVLVGVGLAAFGAYQLMLARYREVLDS